MKNRIVNIESVSEYNDILGIETLHPLVSVIDMSQASAIRHMRHTFGMYVIFLKDVKCGDMIYGRHRYDYQEGTLVCLAPGQVIGFEDNGETFRPQRMGVGVPSGHYQRHVVRKTHKGVHVFLVRG